jgi:hypothetical protein
VLGIELSFDNVSGCRQNPNSPSVDQLDSAKGYSSDNIRIVSWRANDIKGNASLGELQRVVRWLEEQAHLA